MLRRVLLLVSAILLAPQGAGGSANCDCISPDSCMVICPAGDMPFNVFLYSDDECMVPVVGFDCLRLDLSRIGTRMAVCPEAAGDWPYVFPDAPSDSKGRVQFTARLKGCSSDSPVYLQVCGCEDTPIACVKSLDIDMNGWVGGDDIAYCESMLGTDECCCDFDCDGIVDADDMDIIRAHLLHSCGGSSGCETALVTPANGANCLGTEVLLDWRNVGGAAAYEVQIGTACESGTTYVAGGSEKTVSGLDPGTPYYWRVRAECDGEWGAWTACNTFTTAPAAPGVPTLVSPSDGQTKLPTTVTLVWDCVPDAVGYEVQAGAGCGTGTTYSMTSCSKELSGLDPGTEYCWTVRAEGECNIFSDWSDCRCFRTAPPPPPPNANAKWALHFAGPHNSKSNTCSFVPVDCVDVAVDAPAGGGRYDVYVIAVDVDGIAGTRYGLGCDGPFYFYGWTKCSDLEIPTDGWPGCAGANAQIWSQEQAGPHVTVGILDVYCYGSSVSLGTAPDPRVDYAEWCDGSQPSPQCRRKTDADAFGSIGFGVPGYNPCSRVPVGLSAFEGRATEEGIMLEWTSGGAAGFSHFFLQRGAISRDGEYLRLHEDPLVGAGLGGRDYSYLDTEVIPGTLYYYKLEGVERGGGSVFFGPYAVRASEVRAGYRLSQNAPNPFSASAGTTIRYSLQAPGSVEISILDAAGRMVKRIAQHGVAGENCVVWDAKAQTGERVPSGVYFYQLKSGHFTSQRKMMVVD